MLTSTLERTLSAQVAIYDVPRKYRKCPKLAKYLTKEKVSHEVNIMRPSSVWNHIELATKTKIFCGCSTAFGERQIPIHARCVPVCRFLPVLNKQVVEYATAVGQLQTARLTSTANLTVKTILSR